MILFRTLQKCMNQLPDAIRARFANFSESDLTAMIESVLVYITPEVPNILRPNISFQVKFGDIHFAFLFIGETGELHSVQRLSRRGYWENCSFAKTG